MSTSRNGNTVTVTTAAAQIVIASGITGIESSTTGSNSKTVTVQAGDLEFDLPRGSGARFVSGSLTLTWGTRVYHDRLGKMVHSINPATGAGTEGGTIDYATGKFIPSDAAGMSTIMASLQSSAEQNGTAYLHGGCFLCSVAPVRSGQLSVVATLADGTQVNATFNNNGYLVTPNAVGVCDYEAGWARVWFRSATATGFTQQMDLSAYNIPGVTTINCMPALADTFRYNCVGYSYLPADADILGIDPVRLPADGRVPIFQAGQIVVVHDTQKTAAMAVSAGQTVSVGRTRLARLRVIGADGKTITAGYSTDLDAGTVTFADVSSYSQPVKIEHRIEDMIKVTDVGIDGTLKLARPLTHDYPQGAAVSSALIIGDMRARVSVLFDQGSWTSVWADSVIGDVATGTYDDIHYPIEVTNAGTFTERWALVFTNATSFYVMGEHLGVIGSGNTTTDFSVKNPVSNTPYFTIRAAGYGNGFSAGNVIRFNTIGAMAPVWEALTCQVGELSGVEFKPTVQIRGNVDRP